MATANYLPEVLETTEAERLATGFIFTDGPLWHLDGYWYFVHPRRNKLLRLTPGTEPELVRTTIGSKGARFNRPTDVICHSNGCPYFTDPDKRRPCHELEIPGPAGEDNLWDGARVYCLAPAGGLSVRPHANIRTGSRCRPTNARCTSRIRVRRNTSTRSGSRPTATWSGAASSPT
jgi:hypothetical protein